MMYIVIERISSLLFTIATNISIWFIYLFSFFFQFLFELLLSNEMTVIVFWTRIKLATDRISAGGCE